ncbi:MAG: hypothetical protein EOO27_18840 [Comamonadaceae bacterium]|nr:MAG: hypothetical protein EOO27_18840 [Comamonadaceae bacterium]
MLAAVSLVGYLGYIFISSKEKPVTVAAVTPTITDIQLLLQNGAFNGPRKVVAAHWATAFAQ